MSNDEFLPAINEYRTYLRQSVASDRKDYVLKARVAIGYADAMLEVNRDVKGELR